MGTGNQSLGKFSAPRAIKLSALGLDKFFKYVIRVFGATKVKQDSAHLLFVRLKHCGGL